MGSSHDEQPLSNAGGVLLSIEPVKLRFTAYLHPVSKQEMQGILAWPS